MQMYHLIEHVKCSWDEHKFNPSLERTMVYWKSMHTSKWGVFYWWMEICFSICYSSNVFVSLDNGTSTTSQQISPRSLFSYKWNGICYTSGINMTEELLIKWLHELAHHIIDNSIYVSLICKLCCITFSSC